MPDDQSDRIIKLLEEIRDLTRERISKFDEYTKATSQRYEEALKRQEEARERALRQRRLFCWISIPLLLLAVGIVFYLGLWVIPGSEEKQYEEQVQQYQMIQSNFPAQPH